MLAQWQGEQGGWLRRARAAAGAGATWTAHTRRGFGRGYGAARRKEVETVAVAPDGRVYGVAQPARWPWAVEYEVLVRCGGRGEEQRWVLAKLRLHKDRGGKVAVAVQTTRAKEDGTRHRGASSQSVVTAMGGAGEEGGMAELFWVFGWGRGARKVGSGGWQESGMRGAAGGGGKGGPRARGGMDADMPMPGGQGAADVHDREGSGAAGEGRDGGGGGTDGEGG